MTYLQQLVQGERGQDLVEYAVLIAILALVALVAVGLVGHLWGDLSLPR